MIRRPMWELQNLTLATGLHKRISRGEAVDIRDKGFRPLRVLLIVSKQTAPALGVGRLGISDKLPGEPEVW